MKLTPEELCSVEKQKDWVVAEGTYKIKGEFCFLFCFVLNV